MVGWWSGDGNADDIADDNPGTLQNGATFAPGEVGQAFSFDGVDDYVQVVNEEPFDFGSNPFSISVWVKTLSGRSFNEHILSKGDLWEGGDDYTLWVSSEELGVGRVSFQYSFPSENDLQSTGLVADGNWHHISVTQAGVCSSCAKLYIDGKLEDTKDSQLLTNGVDPFLIGATFSGGQLFSFKGSIDEVAVFNRALSASEILAIYNAGSAGMCKEPDNDRDGVPNDEDECPNSDLSATVGIDDCDSEVTNTVFPSGCTLADLLADCTDNARKRRKFVHCVTKLAHTMERIGIITGLQKDAIRSCAVQADLP